MKKVFLVLISLILTVSSMVALSACGDTSVGVKIPSYKIDEMTMKCIASNFKENAEFYTNYEILESDKVADYINEVTYYNYHALGFYFDGSKMAGEEIICMEIDITAETDVEGRLYIHGGGTDYYDEYEYILKAGEKKTLSIEFQETYTIKKTAQDQMFIINFETNLNEGGPSWKEWTKVKYNISRVEIGVAGE